MVYDPITNGDVVRYHTTSGFISAKKKFDEERAQGNLVDIEVVGDYTEVLELDRKVRREFPGYFVQWMPVDTSYTPPDMAPMEDPKFWECLGNVLRC